MQPRRRKWRWIVGGIVLLGALLWTADVVFDDPIEPGRICHPGPRTTWLTEPLLPDGGVDYVAAVRAELSRGVTAENNFTPVLSAMLKSSIRDAEEAPDFERPARLLEAWDEWSEHELSKSASDSSVEGDDDDTAYDANTAWIEGRFDGRFAPYVRRWLDEMSPTLDCIAREADRRERAFVPLTAPLLLMDGTSSVAIRRVLPIFVARALKRATERDAKGCVEDFTTAFELLDRSEKNSPTLYRISRRVGETLLSRAVLLAATRFSFLDCAAFRRIHGRCPDATVEADLVAMVQHERLALLDVFIYTARHPEVVESMTDEAENMLVSVMRSLVGKTTGSAKDPVAPDPGRTDAPAHTATASAVAVDALLEELNARFDRLASILTSPRDWSVRIAEVDAYYAEIARVGGRSKRQLLMSVPGIRRLPWIQTEFRRSTADTTLSISFPLIRTMAKDFVQRAAECDANRVRCAAACFRNEHHRPPRDLAELVAACFDAPPVDRVCGSPMQLTLRDDGEVEVSSAATPLAERLKAEREAERHGHAK